MALGDIDEVSVLVEEALGWPMLADMIEVAKWLKADGTRRKSRW